MMWQLLHFRLTPYNEDDRYMSDYKNDTDGNATAMYKGNSLLQAVYENDSSVQAIKEDKAVYAQTKRMKEFCRQVAMTDHVNCKKTGRWDRQRFVFKQQG